MRGIFCTEKGCDMGKFKDMTGNKYGRLTAIKRVHKDGFNRVCWLCKCDCGNELIVTSDNLRNGHTKSCGCLKEETSRKLLTTHGLSETRMYKIYKDMKTRTTNKNCPEYKNYGGRGIKICDEWLSDFRKFYYWSINNGYKDELTIDRIDVNGNYEPSNCRWTTQKVQQNNRTNNHNITYNGETHTMKQWAERLGIKYKTLERRINAYHLTIEKAFTK